MINTLPQTIDGCPSWPVAASSATAAVTVEGGHLGAVVFDLAGRRVRPMHTAPWTQSEHASALSSVERMLRGDFFCLPFGQGMPLHGVTANEPWRLIEIADGGRRLRASMRLDQSGGGRVEKTIRLVDGHTMVYQRHEIQGLRGRYCFGHHAMLRFPDEPGCARISTSPFVRGQVSPEPVETPPRGKSALLPGACFDHLDSVPALGGETSDLTVYPARSGCEDIVQVFSAPDAHFAWNAVSVARHGYCWFSLRKPETLTGTMMWMSNGGRHYPPWNGQHTNVLGIEDVTSYFHFGQESSVRENPASQQGMTTALRGDQDIRYIWGVASIPQTFGKVATIVPRGHGVRLTDEAGQAVDVAVDLQFLTPTGPNGNGIVRSPKRR